MQQTFKYSPAMKNISGIFLLIALTWSLSSCDMLNVNIDTTLTADLNIDVEETALKSLPTGFPFYAEVTIDPMSDPDVQEYIDNINDWTVNGVTAQVTWVSAEELVFSAGTFFRVSDGADTAQWTLTEDFEVVEGAELVLDNVDGDWDTVQTILRKNSEFLVSTGGEANMYNVSVTIRLSIDATVSASPLGS